MRRRNRNSQPLASINTLFATKENLSNRLPEIDIIPVGLKQENQGYTLPELFFVDKKEDTKTYSPKKKVVKKSKRTLADMGYKNPFVYTNCNFTSKQKESKQHEISNNKWTCMICNEVTANKESLIDHYEKHKNEKESRTEQLNATQNIEDYFKCVVCTREFTSSRSYEKHLELKHGENRYACEQCNKTYKNSFQLCLHNFSAHPDDGKYKCIACDFTTANRASLRSHIEKHENDYRFQCEICDKKFLRSSWFEEHKNSHTGAMPFQCEVCTKSFPYSRYLVAHKKSVHPQMYSDTPAINRCEICSKQFAHKKSLIVHIRSHTGENTVLCDMCGKSLSSTEHLKQHLRIHTGYKPHVCSICGKGFAKKSNLTLHERVHSGEKPYICRNCGKSFSQRSTLVIHERYHSGERPYTCPLCNKGFVAKGLLGVHLKSCSRIPLSSAPERVTSGEKKTKNKKKRRLIDCISLLGSLNKKKHANGDSASCTNEDYANVGLTDDQTVTKKESSQSSSRTMYDKAEHNFASNKTHQSSSVTQDERNQVVVTEIEKSEGKCDKTSTYAIQIEDPNSKENGNELNSDKTDYDHNDNERNQTARELEQLEEDCDKRNLDSNIMCKTHQTDEENNRRAAEEKENSDNIEHDGTRRDTCGTPVKLNDSNSEDDFYIDVGIEEIVEQLNSNDTNNKVTRNDEHKMQRTIKRHEDEQMINNNGTSNNKKLTNTIGLQNLDDNTVNNKISKDNKLNDILNNDTRNQNIDEIEKSKIKKLMVDEQGINENSNQNKIGNLDFFQPTAKTIYQDIHETEGQIRRKRGRPRIKPLIPIVQVKQENNQDVCEMDQIKIRRGRGRPRIRPLIPIVQVKQENNQDVCDMDQIKIRRGRGRPRIRPPKPKPTIHRKRGRPRIRPLKVDQENNEEASTINQDEKGEEGPKEETVKRKRGRPRIVRPSIPFIRIKQEHDQDQLYQTPDGLRRKRGRPRIRPLNPDLENGPKIPKKRGRPRIRPLEPSFDINQATNELETIPFVNIKQEHDEDSCEVEGGTLRRSGRCKIDQKYDEDADETKEPRKRYKTRGRPKSRKLFKPIFKCCSVIFTKRTQLFSHMQQLHSSNDHCQPVYVCSLCSTEFNLYLDLYRHSKGHSGLIVPKHRFFCGRCFHPCSNLWCVRKHQMAAIECQLILNPPKVKGFLDLKTEFDDYCFSGKTLQNYLVVNVPYKTEFFKPMKMKNEFDYIDDGNEYRCDICYDIFDDIEKLLEHERLHEEMSTFTNSDETNEYSEIKIEASTSCDPSLLKTTKSNVLTLRPLSELSREIPETITLSKDTSTSQEDNLETDIRNTADHEHAEALLNVSSSSLIDSSKRIEQDEINVDIETVSDTCSECNEKFCVDNALEHHKVKAKFTNHCDHCDYFTCLSSNLKNHYLLQHNIKHFCEFCLLVFDTEQDFESHSEFHVCPKCKKYCAHLGQHLEEIEHCLVDVEEENTSYD